MNERLERINTRLKGLRIDHVTVKDDNHSVVTLHFTQESQLEISARGDIANDAVPVLTFMEPTVETL